MKEKKQSTAEGQLETFRKAAKRVIAVSKKEIEQREQAWRSNKRPTETARLSQ